MDASFTRELERRACAKIIQLHDDHLDEWLAHPRRVSVAEIHAFMAQVIDTTAAEMQAEAAAGERHW